MKLASILLRVLAVLAAGASVYFWFNTKGRISTAENHMKGVPGATLEEKAPKIPGILQESNKRKLAFESERDAHKKTQELYEKTERTRKRLSDDLKSARADIDSKDIKIEGLEKSLASEKALVATKVDEIGSLNRQIKEKDKELERLGEIDLLKVEVASLKEKLAEKDKLVAEAEEKIKKLNDDKVNRVLQANLGGQATQAQASAVVADANSNVEIAAGEKATVVSVNRGYGLLIINRGANNGIKAAQTILLKNKDGILVSEIVITEVGDDFAVGAINKNKAIPETIEAGDLLELVVPQVAEKSEEKADA